MADVRPLWGIRYDAGRFGQDLSDVVCPPYDVISPSEQQSLYARDPCNVVRLELPMDGDGVSRYERAAVQYRAWLRDGSLREESTPAMYAYVQVFSIQAVRHERRGIVAAVRLAPWEQRVVRPHERTLAGPKRDRLELMRACRANFSPIWGLYHEQHQVTDAVWETTAGREPDAEATDREGVRHQVWVVSDPAALNGVHAALAGAPIYIADGHHRYETALHYRSEMLAESPGAPSVAAANFAMIYLVDSADPGLVVLGTHRLIRSPRPLDAPMVRRLLEERFELEDCQAGPAALLDLLEAGKHRPAFAIWAPGLGLAAIATAREASVPEALADGHSGAWRRLDLAALHALAIDRIYPEGTSALSEAGLLTYHRALAEVQGAIDSGEAELAFLVRRTPVDQILAVADAGDLMPEKSTYFYPKPVTGMVIGNLEGEIPLLD